MFSAFQGWDYSGRLVPGKEKDLPSVYTLPGSVLSELEWMASFSPPNMPGLWNLLSWKALHRWRKGGQWGGGEERMEEQSDLRECKGLNSERSKVHA